MTGDDLNKKKLLKQIYNNIKNVKFNDMIALAKALGFHATRSE